MMFTHSNIDVLSRKVSSPSLLSIDQSIETMKVSKEVREVTRPEKTIVYGYVDKNGDVRYGVKERTYWKEDGKQHQRDGPTIGHIESGIFVPIPEDPIPPISYAESDMLSWGPYQLIVKRTQDLMEDCCRSTIHRMPRRSTPSPSCGQPRVV